MLRLVVFVHVHVTFYMNTVGRHYVLSTHLITNQPLDSAQLTGVLGKL